MRGHQSDEQIRQLHKADERRSDARKVIKLPCCGTSVELRRTGDQLIACPNCGKRNAVTWGLQPTISTEPPKRPREGRHTWL